MNQPYRRMRLIHETNRSHGITIAQLNKMEGKVVQEVSTELIDAIHEVCNPAEFSALLAKINFTIEVCAGDPKQRIGQLVRSVCVQLRQAESDQIAQINFQVFLGILRWLELENLVDKMERCYRGEKLSGKFYVHF